MSSTENPPPYTSDKPNDSSEEMDLNPIESEMDQVNTQIQKHSADITKISESISTLTSMITEQHAEHKSDIKTILEKLGEKEAGGRGRSRTRDKPEKLVRTSSNPEITKNWYQINWPKFKKKDEKKDDSEIEEGNLYPNVSITRNPTTTERSFVKEDQPQPPKPFPTDQQQKQLYVNMPTAPVQENINKVNLSNQANTHQNANQQLYGGQQIPDYNRSTAPMQENEDKINLSNPFYTSQLAGQHAGQQMYGGQQAPTYRMEHHPQIHQVQMPDQEKYIRDRQEMMRNYQVEPEIPEARTYGIREDPARINMVHNRIADGERRPYTGNLMNNNARYPDEGNLNQRSATRNTETFQPGLNNNTGAYGGGAYGGLSFNDLETNMTGHNRQQVHSHDSLIIPKLKDSNQYNDKLVHETIKYLSHTVKLTLKDTTLMTFLRQFSLLSHRHFTFSTIDYIQVINSFVGPDIQKEMGRHGVWLEKLNYTEYIDLIKSLKNGFYTTPNDILNKLGEINAKSMSLTQLFITVTDEIDSIDDRVWPPHIKAQNTFYYCKKHLSPSLRQNIDALLRMSEYGEDIYPSRASIRNFMLRAQNNLNMSKGNKQFNINKVNDKNGTKEKNTEKYWCEFCNRKGGHSTDNCFYHSDQEIGHQNQQRAKIKNCMLCRDESHMALNCEKYPNQMPVFNFCTHCIKKGKRMHHKSSGCKEEAEN